MLGSVTGNLVAGIDVSFNCSNITHTPLLGQPPLSVSTLVSDGYG